MALLTAGAVIWLWSTFSSRIPSKALPSEEFDEDDSDLPSKGIQRPTFEEIEVKPTLSELISDALASPRRRAEILDILAGAPYEFSQGMSTDQAFYHLPRIAAAAAVSKGEVVGGQSTAEKELHKTVLQVIAGGGWPRRLQRRLEASVRATEVSCSSTAKPIPLEVDVRSTSTPATSSGWLHQGLLSLGEKTGLPELKARAELYRSRPPTVVLSETPAVAESRDCLALRGTNTTLAVRIAGPSSGQVVQQLVIEQPPRWAALRPRSSPRHFSVYADVAEVEKSSENMISDKYDKFLGAFEYSLAAPSAQAFHLQGSDPVRGLQLRFEGQGWGESFICLYRLRAFEAFEPACSGERVAVVV